MLTLTYINRENHLHNIRSIVVIHDVNKSGARHSISRAQSLSDEPDFNVGLIDHE